MLHRRARGSRGLSCPPELPPMFQTLLWTFWFNGAGVGRGSGVFKSSQGSLLCDHNVPTAQGSHDFGPTIDFISLSKRGTRDKSHHERHGAAAYSCPRAAMTNDHKRGASHSRNGAPARVEGGREPEAPAAGPRPRRPRQAPPTPHGGSSARGLGSRLGGSNLSPSSRLSCVYVSVSVSW